MNRYHGTLESIRRTKFLTKLCFYLHDIEHISFPLYLLVPSSDKELSPFTSKVVFIYNISVTKQICVYAMHCNLVSNVLEPNLMAASLAITYSILMEAPAELYKGANDSLNSVFLQFSSVQFSSSVLYDSLRPHGLQHTRPSCPLPTPRIYSNSHPLSLWCHPTISSSVIPFSSCPQSFPTSGSFQMSQFFASGGQSIGVSASASDIPMNTLGKCMFSKPFEKPGERWEGWCLGNSGVDHT